MSYNWLFSRDKGFKDYTEPEMIQRRAIRFYLGVHRHAANCAVEGDMGWLACNNRRKLVILDSWNRLSTIYNTGLLHHVFVFDLLYDSVSNTWTKEISEVFQEINTTESYRNYEVCDLHIANKNILYVREKNEERFT